MYKKLILFFLLLIVSLRSPLFAQNSEVYRVVEKGAETTLPDSIQQKITAGEDSLRHILAGWYTEQGFLNSKIDSVSGFSIYISRGCAFTLAELEISYQNEPGATDTISGFGLYNRDKLLAYMAGEIRKMEEQGYPFASTRIQYFEPDYSNCEVEAGIHIQPGKKAVSSSIYFSGAETNSQEYLHRISGFRDSVTITPAYLRYLKSNLNASELFNSVGDAQIYLREGKPVIIFEVEERSLNQFDGLLGYAPDASGEGQIVGDVELSLWNVLAQGNGVDFRYQRLRPETSQLNLGASQEWIKDIPVGISMGFQLYQNDTTYQSREFNLGGSYRLVPGFKITGGIGFQASTAGNDAPMIIEPDSRKRSGRFGFTYTSVDNFDVPTTGNRIRVNFTLANKDLEEDSLAAFTQRSLHAEIESYFPLFSKSVIATSVNGFFLDADKATINDLMRFGGATSLRGYAEDQFRAGKMIWADLEYRFLLDRSSYLFTFTAMGWYERPRLITESDNTFKTQDYLYSGGFGLSYRTRIGRLTFSYAISPEESIGNGKVHFGIRTEL